MENKEKTLYKSKHARITFKKNNKKEMIVDLLGWLTFIVIIILIVWWLKK